TMRTLDQNGSRVYSGIYKRMWEAMSDGYCQQYELNALHLPDMENFVDLTTGKGAMIRQIDYQGPLLDIVPSADPYVISDAQKIQRDLMLINAANTLPGFNRYETQAQWLKDMKVPNQDRVMPPPMQQGPDGQMVRLPDYQPPPNPKMLELQIKQQDLQ